MERNDLDDLVVGRLRLRGVAVSLSGGANLERGDRASNGPDEVPAAVTEPGAPPEPITRDCVFDLTRMLEQIRNMQVFLTRERALRKREEKEP